MKSPISSPIFLCLALAGLAAADVPKKAPFTRYTSLYTNSPFTSKPPPAEAGPENNPLDDYALIGVSSIGLKSNGDSIYRVTLINKKKPEDRITVDSDNPKSDFKILGVTRKSGDPLGTVVAMSSGSMKGTVAFDEKLLTLAAPKAAAPVPNPAQPGQQPQVQPDGQPIAQRQPRPRVVPPPTAQAGGQPAQPVAQPNNQQNTQQQQRGAQPRVQRRGNN